MTESKSSPSLQGLTNIITHHKYSLSFVPINIAVEGEDISEKVELQARLSICKFSVLFSKIIIRFLQVNNIFFVISMCRQT